MENRECPHCGNMLAKGMAICGACGKEVNDDERAGPQENKPGRKNVYAILAVLLVILGGAALLVSAGLLPNPLKGGGSTAAIVNGEKISIAEVDQKFDLYKKRFGNSGQPDWTTPDGKAAAADMRRQILNAMIQERILITEAVKEKITVPPQDIADKISAVKKNLNLSDKDFDEFLKKHGMGLADFEKRVERDFLIERLIARGTQQKGLTKDAWIAELRSRAKVEILIK